MPQKKSDKKPKIKPKGYKCIQGRLDSDTYMEAKVRLAQNGDSWQKLIERAIETYLKS